MSSKMEVIEYYDRKTGELCRENVMGDAAIKWAYRSLSGKIFAPFIFGSSIMSRLLGFYFDSSFSKSKISQVILDLNIDESEFAKVTKEFSSFNDFFTRKLKSEARPFSSDKNCVLSPADGRLLVYNEVSGRSLMKVKGVEDSLDNLFGDELTDFNDGHVAVVRLCPSDYHRYHFPCDGTVVDEVKIKGKFHSVNPIALKAKKRIFCINKRSYTLIETEEFGKIAFMEVGAFGVAGIHQTYSGIKVNRMQEKGYFDFGGSTVILLFQKGTIKFDADLIENSKSGIETLVKAGATIGYSI